MRIEHVALYVSDLESTKKFFMKYFRAKSNDGYHNQKTGFCSLIGKTAYGALLN